MKPTISRILAVSLIVIGLFAFILSFNAYTVFFIWLSPILFILALFLLKQNRDTFNKVAFSISLMGILRDRIASSGSFEKV